MLEKNSRHLFRRCMTETEEAKAHNIFGMTWISRKILFPVMKELRDGIKRKEEEHLDEMRSALPCMKHCVGQERYAGVRRGLIK